MKKRNMKKLLEYLDTIPNISTACEKANISRNTFYRWMKEYPEFKAVFEEAYLKGLESMSDLAESKLFSKINQSDFKAIKYYLDNNNPRYRKPRPRSIFDTVEDDDSISAITIKIDRE
jgi:hypothetical protein